MQGKSVCREKLGYYATILAIPNFWDQSFGIFIFSYYIDTRTILHIQSHMERGMNHLGWYPPKALTKKKKKEPQGDGRRTI